MTWNPQNKSGVRVPARVGTRTSLNRNFGDSPYWLSDRTSTKKLCFFIAVHRARFYFDVSTDDRGMCTYDERWWLLCVLIRGAFPRRDIRVCLASSADPFDNCPPPAAAWVPVEWDLPLLRSLFLLPPLLLCLLMEKIAVAVSLFPPRAAGEAAVDARVDGFPRRAFKNLHLVF